MGVINNVASYLESLNATNPICVALGTTLNSSNCFLLFAQDTDNDSMVISTYAGGPPEMDSYKQNPYVQIRFRTSNKQRSYDFQQALIDNLHNKCIDKYTKMFAVNSAPLISGVTEGSEWVISTSNYQIKYVRN